MWKHFVIFLMLLMGKQYAVQSANSPIMGYEYITEADAWLRLHIVPATWADARLRCQLEGGILASPTTSALTREMMLRMAATKLLWRTVFTGIHSIISKGNYMTVEGIPLANLSSEWAEGEPDNKDNSEDCLVMTGAGTLADVSCASVHPYFCRKESSKMTLNECGTTDNDYKKDLRTGSCYKFHLVPRTWYQAEAACVAEGGHLAVVNSHTESQVLKEIYAKYPDNTIFGARYTHIAMIGFWDWNERNRSADWLTIFGETLEDAGFALWDQGEPNNFGGIEHCGSISRSGLLNDFECDRNAVFICEITP